MKKGPTPPPNATDALTLPLTRLEAPSLREDTPAAPPRGDCSRFRCAAGHEWPPRLGTAHCGCAAAQPVVAARFANCPVCNEPPTSLRVRIDITTMAIGIAARCVGQDAASVTAYADIPIEPPAPATPRTVVANQETL